VWLIGEQTLPNDIAKNNAKNKREIERKN